MNHPIGQLTDDTHGRAIELRGADAQTAEQFRHFEPVTYSGLHLTLGTPWGRYDPSARTNAGSNRWSLKTLVNYSITSDAGRTWIDFYPSVRVFGDNDEYLGGRRLSQRPVFGLEAHWSTTLAMRTWLSVGLIASAGGAVAIDGVRSTGSQDSIRAAIGAGFPTWPGGTGILAWSRTAWHGEGVTPSTSFMVQLIHKF